MTKMQPATMTIIYVLSTAATIASSINRRVAASSEWKSTPLTLEIACCTAGREAVGIKSHILSVAWLRKLVLEKSTFSTIPINLRKYDK